MTAAGMARLTRDFIAAGGRVLVPPRGLVEPRMDMALIYHPDVPDDMSEHRRAVTRKMIDAVQRPDGAAFATRAARAAGMQFNGWHILPC